MKKLLFLTFIISFIFVTSPYLYSQCRPKVIAKACKPNMGDFTYDAFVLNELIFDDKPKIVEVQFTAFAGEKYKFVFCSSGFQEAVELNIYDKSNKVKKRNKIYDHNSGIDNLFWSFSPSKAGTYYIEYNVPVALDPQKKSTGCMVMLIGYEE